MSVIHIDSEMVEDNDMNLLQGVIEYVRYRTDLGKNGDQSGYQIKVMYENQPSSGGIIEECETLKIVMLRNAYGVATNSELTGKVVVVVPRQGYYIVGPFKN